MTIYDLIFLVILAISVLTGLMRGGLREIVTLMSFIVAVLLAIWLLPITAPIAGNGIKSPVIGAMLAFAVIFFFGYFGTRTLGQWASQKLHSQKTLGGIDRFFGFSFGVFRALVLLGVFHLIFSATTPPSRQPAWFKGAMIYPVSTLSAKAVQVIAPKGAHFADTIAPSLEQSIRKGTQAT